MLDKDIEEARFDVNICNACRYCENICPVFKAIELRREFSENDLIYLSNLCHDCRGCYYACQYAPPHNFNINMPKVLSNLRLKTYSNLGYFKSIKGFFKTNRLQKDFVIMITMFLFYILSSLLIEGGNSLFRSHLRAGAFYKVLPENFIIITMLIPFLLMIFIYFKNILFYCKYIEINKRHLLNPINHCAVLKSIFLLEFLGGGGYGCNYPDERYSFARRIFHQVLFFGFTLSFFSTIVAAIMDHIFNQIAPYPVYSLPVLLGLTGGILMIVGLFGILYLRLKMDREPYHKEMHYFDISFILILTLVTMSGFFVLFFRNTVYMPILLIVHLSIVSTFFITLPYNKMQHAVYRYISLFKYFAESKV